MQTQSELLKEARTNALTDGISMAIYGGLVVFELVFAGFMFFAGNSIWWLYILLAVIWGACLWMRIASYRIQSDTFRIKSETQELRVKHGLH